MNFKEELEEVKAELANIKESQKEATEQKKASETSEAMFHDEDELLEPVATQGELNSRPSCAYD